MPPATHRFGASPVVPQEPRVAVAGRGGHRHVPFPCLYLHGELQLQVFPRHVVVVPLPQGVHFQHEEFDVAAELLHDRASEFFQRLFQGRSQVAPPGRPRETVEDPHRPRSAGGLLVPGRRGLRWALRGFHVLVFWEWPAVDRPLVFRGSPGPGGRRWPCLRPLRRRRPVVIRGRLHGWGTVSICHVVGQTVEEFVQLPWGEEPLIPTNWTQRACLDV